MPRLAGAHHQRDRKALSGSQRHDETAECSTTRARRTPASDASKRPWGVTPGAASRPPKGVIAPRLPYGLEADFT